MNREDKINVVRKRNIELARKIDELQNQLKNITDGKTEVEELILELERIKADWEKALNDLTEKRLRYDALIYELESAKEIMANMGFKIPWYKKLNWKQIK